LEKIADEDLRRREALQFAGLGAAVGPGVGAVSNLIQHGHLAPQQVSLKRWIPASMLSGAIFGGVVPTLRHAIHRHNISERAAT
jgi:hypothetical protein